MGKTDVERHLKRDGHIKAVAEQKSQQNQTKYTTTDNKVSISYTYTK